MKATDFQGVSWSHRSGPDGAYRAEIPDPLSDSSLLGLLHTIHFSLGPQSGYVLYSLQGCYSE